MLGMVDLPVSSCSSTSPALRERGGLHLFKTFSNKFSTNFQPDRPQIFNQNNHIYSKVAPLWLPCWGQDKGRAACPKTREWFLSTDQVHRQIPEKGKVGGSPEELLTRFPPPVGPVANIIRFVRPGLFPKQCKGYIALNKQVYGPIDVKHDCDTNSSRCKQNDDESFFLLQILKSFCRLVLRCTMGMEQP